MQWIYISSDYTSKVITIHKMNINEEYLLNIVGCRAINRDGWTDGRIDGQTGPDNNLRPQWGEGENHK